MTEFFKPPAVPDGRLTAFLRPSSRGGRLGPATGVVPGVAPVEGVLARTDDVAVSLGPVWVYPTGLEFQILVDARDPETDLEPFDRGRRRPGSATEDGPGMGFRFGFQFADGSKVTTLHDGLGSASGSESQAPILLHRSGSSYEGHWTQRYWLWPSTPPGRIELICEWAAAGIPLTRIELHADAIAGARSRSRAIFSDDRQASR